MRDTGKKTKHVNDHTGQKSPWRWLCLTVAICSGIVLLFGSVMAVIAGSSSFSADIGIIGGADGPTAVMVGSSSSSSAVTAVIVIALLIGSIYGFYRLSRCKRK